MSSFDHLPAQDNRLSQSQPGDAGNSQDVQAAQDCLPQIAISSGNHAPPSIQSVLHSLSIAANSNPPQPSVWAVLRLLSLDLATGSLLVTTGSAEQTEVYFKKGVIVNAQCRHGTGANAIYELLDACSTQCRFRAGVTTTELSVPDLNTISEEASQLWQQMEFLREHGWSDDAFICRRFTFVDQIDVCFGCDQFKLESYANFYTVVDGKHPAQAIAFQLGLTKRECVPILFRLWENRLIYFSSTLSTDSQAPANVYGISDADAFWTRYIAAGTEHLPVWLSEQLASDSNRAVRRRIAENAATPNFILQRLARDTDEDVRIAITENASVPFDLLVKLASDASLSVRLNMAANRDLPYDLLQQLAEDANPYVALRAQRTFSSKMRTDSRIP